MAVLNTCSRLRLILSTNRTRMSTGSPKAGVPSRVFHLSDFLAPGIQVGQVEFHHVSRHFLERSALGEVLIRAGVVPPERNKDLRFWILILT